MNYSYYLYRHIRPDLDVPFYIGIGKKRKDKNFTCYTSEYRRAYMYKERSPHWKHIFNTCNGCIDVEIMYESTSRDIICQKEKEFITLYGRRDLRQGPLVNFTDGGEGPSGYIKTKEQIEKHRKAITGRRLSEEHKQKIHEKMKGRVMSEETRRKMGAWQVGRKFSEKTKKILSEQRMGNKFSQGTKRSPEYIERLKSRPITQETRDKISKGRTGIKLSDEHKKKIGQAGIGRVQSEATKAKRKASMDAYYARRKQQNP